MEKSAWCHRCARFCLRQLSRKLDECQLWIVRVCCGCVQVEPQLGLVWPIKRRPPLVTRLSSAGQLRGMAAGKIQPLSNLCASLPHTPPPVVGVEEWCVCVCLSSGTSMLVFIFQDSEVSASTFIYYDTPDLHEVPFDLECDLELY